MAEYTFTEACAADIWTRIANGVLEIGATLPVAGRLCVQDAADPDLTNDKTRGVGVGENFPINLAVSGLEVWYMPLGVNANVVGMRK
jgi:hypothetical protein